MTIEELVGQPVILKVAGYSDFVGTLQTRSGRYGIENGAVSVWVSPDDVWDVGKGNNIWLRLRYVDFFHSVADEKTILAQLEKFTQDQQQVRVDLGRGHMTVTVSRGCGYRGLNYLVDVNGSANWIELPSYKIDRIDHQNREICMSLNDLDDGG